MALPRARTGSAPHQPMFFKSAAYFRRWLAEHHAASRELWVGYYKRDSGRPSMTWPESVDAALCFGWIDGLRKSLGDLSYTIRFSPRKPGSVWSNVNVRRLEALMERGLVEAAGLRAYEARKENTSGIYSYEQRMPGLDEPYERVLRENGAAWAFFQAQTPSYRKAATWWVHSAKREETRLKRLRTLIECCERGEPIRPLARVKPRK